MSNKFLSTREAAEAARVSESLIKKWIKLRIIYAEKKTPGVTSAYMIPASEIDRILRERKGTK